MPTTTTKHAVRARRRTLRVGPRHSWVIFVPIVTPLPNIAGHIINAKFIWLLLLYGVSLLIAIITVPSYGVYTVAAAVFVIVVLAFVATAGCKLPLGLGRQTEFTSIGQLAGKQGVEFVYKIYAIVVAYLFNRIVAAFEVRRIIAHYRLPKCLCHLGLTNIIVAKGY